MSALIADLWPLLATFAATVGAFAFVGIRARALRQRRIVSHMEGLLEELYGSDYWHPGSTDLDVLHSDTGGQEPRQAR